MNNTRCKSLAFRAICHSGLDPESTTAQGLYFSTSVDTYENFSRFRGKPGMTNWPEVKKLSHLVNKWLLPPRTFALSMRPLCR